MTEHIIDFFEAFEELRTYTSQYKFVKQSLIGDTVRCQFDDHEQFLIPLPLYSRNQQQHITNWLSSFESEDALIFGKNPTENIVSCESTDSSIELFIEKEGVVSSKVISNRYYILSPKKYSDKWETLKGQQHYKYIKYYDSLENFYIDRRKLKGQDFFCISDAKESAMVLNGFTYFKGMKVNDVSVLSFDIEATTLGHSKDSKVLLISNTFRRNGKVTKKLFAYDEYETEAEMFDDWSLFVRETNASVIVGHNIYGYDLPYLNFCAAKAGTTLSLGRDGSNIKFNKYESKFRKDGSQDYMYKRCHIYGREIVDTMFVSYHYDFSRKYESYGLKQIIKQEGLEIQGRQFYDASVIYKNYKIPEEWEKIKQYSIHDSDDALALYDLMIPSFFYLTSTVPKSFQAINYTASGSQLNSFLVRSYLQQGWSIPKADEARHFTGAISEGNPGVYNNCWKQDISALYPSIMRQYEVCDKRKDPKEHFKRMVEYFTVERLKNKKLGKETGQQYYKDLDQMAKICVNSAYGLLGATGLNFNSPENANFVTSKGREILTQGMDWATKTHNFNIVNVDTDSLMICKPNQSEFSEEERKQLLNELNSLFPEKIEWCDDGYFSCVVVLKAKNYVLKDTTGKIKIKGSALRSSKTEKGLKCFMEEVIGCLLNNDAKSVELVYNKYIREVHKVTDISRWSKKVTVTDKVLSPERTNEQKVLDAIGDGEVQMGDKIYVFFDKEGNLKLQKNWTGNHDTVRLTEKLFKTLKIFQNVLDIKQFPNYKLKRNKLLLEQILNEV